jgi:hypothetical protein
MIEQSSDTVLIIVPQNFGLNPETAETNEFQGQTTDSAVAEKARTETENLIQRLEEEGVHVIRVEDKPENICPDAVFSNNWLGLHPGKKCVIYKMQSPLRRKEVRLDVIDTLQKQIGETEVINLLEMPDFEGEFLEGTGSLVFDHLHKKAYAALSARTSERLARKVTDLLKYELIPFETSMPSGKPVYHTNVMLCIGTGFIIVAPEIIKAEQKDFVLKHLQDSGRTIIPISVQQMRSFAGNVLEVRNHLNEKLIVLSSSALNALSAEQIAALQNHGLILESEIPAIEQTGGGSVRCMLTEVYI